jgi:hypothetical protein
MAKKPKSHESQVSQFVAAARELGCDDSEEAFDKKLKAIASAPSPKPAKKPKTKKPAK